MRNVVITGGSRGIGLAIATTLAAGGYRAIAVARSESEELRSAIGKYVTHARKVGGGVRRAGRTAGRTSRGAGSALNTTEIRTWAREQGYDIKDRGRVPADLVAKYQAATGK